MRNINPGIGVVLLCLLPAIILPILFSGNAYIFVFIFLGYTAFAVGYLFARNQNRLDGNVENQTKALGLVLQAMGEIVLIHRMEDHSNIFVSPSVQTVLGYHPDFILKKFTTFIIHPDDRQLVVPRLKIESLQQTPVFEIEVRVRMVDGDYKNMKLEGKGVADEYTGLIAYTVLLFKENTTEIVKKTPHWNRVKA